jgi:hypothetical protein
MIQIDVKFLLLSSSLIKQANLFQINMRSAVFEGEKEGQDAKETSSI